MTGQAILITPAPESQARMAAPRAQPPSAARVVFMLTSQPCDTVTSPRVPYQFGASDGRQAGHGAGGHDADTILSRVPAHTAVIFLYGTARIEA
jgi:hypothetical protein